MSEERAKYVVPRRNDGECSNAHKAASFLWLAFKLAAKSMVYGFAAIGILTCWGLSTGDLDGIVIEQGKNAARSLLTLVAIISLVTFGLSMVFKPLPGMLKGEDP